MVRRSLLVLLVLAVLVALASLGAWVVTWDAEPTTRGVAHPTEHVEPAPAPSETDPTIDTGPAPATIPATTPPDPTRPHVVSSSGTPATGVRVELLVDGEPIQTTRTDERGHFDFDLAGEIPHDAEIRITGPHHRPVQRRWSGSSARSRGPVAIELGRDRRILLRVFGHDDDVPENTRLIVRSGRGDELAVVPADDSGRIVWLPTDEEFSWLLVAGDDHVTARVSGARHGVEHEVRLRAGHTLAGRVVDAHGRAVANAIVRVDAAPPFPAHRARTDGSGRFHLADIEPSSRVRVHVELDGAQLHVTSVATGDEDVLITLPAKGRIVTVESLLLLPGGTPARDLDLPMGRRTDADGRVVIERSVEGGENTLTVGFTADPIDAPGLRDRWFRYGGTTEVRLQPDQERYQIEIQLEPLPISYLPVRVVDADDRAVPSLPIQADGGLSTKTDDRGRALLVFPYRSPGPVRVTSPSTPALRSATHSRAAADGEPDVLVLDEVAPAVVEVRGLPKEGEAEVVWTSLQDLGFPPRAGRARLIGGDDDATVHRFDLGVLPAGRVLVEVRVDRAPVGGALLDRGSLGDAPLQIELADGLPELDLTIRNASGKHLAGVRPVPSLRMGGGWHRRGFGGSTYADPGRWTIHAHSDATVDLLLLQRRRLVGIATVSTSAGSATVTVGDTTHIEGQVRSTDDKPLGGCELRLLIPAGHFPVIGLAPLGTTDADGRFAIDVPDIADAAIAVARYDRATVIEPISPNLAKRLAAVRLPEPATLHLPDGAFAMKARPVGTALAFEPLPDRRPGASVLEQELPLPIGDLELTVRDREGHTRVVRVRTVAGEVVEYRDR